MKNILTTIIILSCTITSFAQNRSDKVDIKWGPELKESMRMTISDIVGYNNGNTFALKTKARGLYGTNNELSLVKYDKSLKQVKAAKLELRENKKEKEYEGIIQIEDELFLFSSFKNQKQKKHYLFVQTINKKNLQPNNDLKKIAEISYPGKSKYNSGEFGFEMARDTSNLLIFYSLPYEKNENEKFGVNVFDKQLNEIWSKEIELPYNDELFAIEDFEVDPFGNVHLLGVNYKERRKSKRNGKPNYNYSILSYLENGTKVEEYTVDIKDKFLTDMQIAINTDKDIICAGFYSDKGTFSIKGNYYLKIDHKTKEIAVDTYNDFDIDFITQNMTKNQEKRAKRKEKKGKENELFRYDLDNIILKSDGGSVLIGEQFYIRTYSTTNSNGGTTTKTRYIYNDIIVINMAPDGETEWTEKIAKRQISTNDGGYYSSYALSIVDDKLYFTFNDSELNLNYSGKGPVKNFTLGNKGVVMLVQMNSNGNQSREALFSRKEASGYLTRPKVCEQVSNNELILFAQYLRKQKLAKITFP